METAEENMSPGEMLEKIAELDHGQSQLRELNASMRLWLDAADEDMAALRSENEALRKQVNVLEKLLSAAPEVEAEPSSLHCHLDVKTSSEKQIQKMEEESATMKELNRTLDAELRSLLQQREQDQRSLGQFRAAMTALEGEVEEARVGLQQREERLHQMNLQLKHLEETVEEFSIIIKDLRQTNQELRERWEDRQDEALLSALSDLTEEGHGWPRPPPSLLEELRLLASDSTHPGHVAEETQTDSELLTPQGVTAAQTRGWSGASAVQRPRLLVSLCLLVLAFGTSGSRDLWSALWSGAHVMLQPYFSVHNEGPPPV